MNTTGLNSIVCTFNLLRFVRPCAFAIAVSAGLASCSSSDSGTNAFIPADPNVDIPEEVDATISEHLLGDQFAFSILLERLQQANLDKTLAEDNNGMGWTIFAPENAVFESDPFFQDWTLAQQIEAVGTFIAPGTLLSTQLIPGDSIVMQDGSTVVVELAPDGASVLVGGARITSRDRVMNNGVIHRVGSLITTQ